MSDQAVEERASALGWQPKERWKGDPDKWVDADQYVKRGEEVLPFLRANNRKLEGELAGSKQKVGELTNALSEMKEQLDGLTEVQADMLAIRLKEARRDLLSRIRKAKEDGDDNIVEELEEELEDNREASREIKDKKERVKEKPAAPKPSATPPEVPQEVQDWLARNPWYGAEGKENRRKTQMANALGNEANQQGMKGKAAFDYIDRELAEQFAPSRGTSKTEEGRPSGGGGGGGSGGGKSYKDLPADAKAMCDAETRFYGEKKTFKDKAAWQEHYAKTYFADER